MSDCCKIVVSSHQSCFFNDTATTEIYTLSLHDALPIFAIQLSLKAPDLLGCFKAHRQSPPPHHLRKRTRSQGPSLRQHYPADRKSTRLNSSHANISYAVFCLKKKIT